MGCIKGSQNTLHRSKVHTYVAQVRVFSSREHTRALSAGDVFAVVGWSGDLLPLAERINDIVLVAPASGTALWADMWAVPWQAQNGSKVGSAAPRPRFQI